MFETRKVTSRLCSMLISRVKIYIISHRITYVLIYSPTISFPLTGFRIGYLRTLWKFAAHV